MRWIGSPTASKRAALPRRSSFTKAFEKDWDRHSRAGRVDLRLAKEVMLLLIANEGPLGPEWKDHPLKGNWQGHRECHVGGDLLLVYRIEEDRISFDRLGTHSEVLGR